jgi:hypothetical protein
MTNSSYQADHDYEEWNKFAAKLWAVVKEPPLAGSQISAPPEFVTAGKVLMFHFVRASRTFQAIGLLAANGFSQDAVVLLRTLVEVFFEMAFIAKYPADASFYLEHGQKLERAWQERARTLAPELLIFLGVPHGASADEPPQKRVSHGAWHPNPQLKTVRQRALAAGVPMTDYDLLYSLASRYVHGSGDWLREVMKASPEGVYVSYGSDRMERRLVLFIACDKFLEMLFMLEGCLKVPIRDRVMELKAEYDILVKQGSAIVNVKYGL